MLLNKLRIGSRFIDSAGRKWIIVGKSKPYPANIVYACRIGAIPQDYVPFVGREEVRRA